MPLPSIPGLDFGSTDTGSAASGSNSAPGILWGSPFAVGSAASSDATNTNRPSATGEPGGATGGGMGELWGVAMVAVVIVVGAALIRKVR